MVPSWWRCVFCWKGRSVRRLRCGPLEPARTSRAVFSAPPSVLRWQHVAARETLTVPPSGPDDEKRTSGTIADNGLADSCFVRKRRVSGIDGSGGVHSLSSTHRVQFASLPLSKATCVLQKGQLEHQQTQVERCVTIGGCSAADGSQNIRAAADATAKAEGALCEHEVYSNVRGAVVHQVNALGTAVDDAKAEEAVLLHLFDSVREHDKPRPERTTEGEAVGWTAPPVVRSSATEECTTAAVTVTQAPVSKSVGSAGRTYYFAAEPTLASLQTASAGALGSGPDLCIESENGQHYQQTQASPVTLDPTQAKALDLALRGCNIFLTGGAGTGKSQTLRAIIGALRRREVCELEAMLRAVANGADSPQRGDSGQCPDVEEPAVAINERRCGQRELARSSPSPCGNSQLRISEPSSTIENVFKSNPRPSLAVPAVPPLSSVFVTATTGLAAVQIHGMTVNTFAGIGLGRGTPEQLFRKVQKNSKAAQRWRRCRVLLIDEVSMLEASLFETLDYIARRVRRCASLPFGGIQVILCGDFFQLPPIAGREGQSVIIHSRGATKPPRPTRCGDGPSSASALAVSLFTAPAAAAAPRKSKLFEIADLGAYLSVPASPGDATSLAPVDVPYAKIRTGAAGAEAKGGTAPTPLSSQVAYPAESFAHAAACAFCFQTVAWAKLGLRAVMLAHPHRQASDALFRRVLDEVRWGTLSMTGYRALASRCVNQPNKTCGQAFIPASDVALEAVSTTTTSVTAAASIRLCATNSEVDARNAHFFSQLPPKCPPMPASSSTVSACASSMRPAPNVSGQGVQAACSTEWVRCYTYLAYDTQAAEATFGNRRSPSAVDAAPSYASDALNDTQLVRILALKVGTRVLLQSNVAPRYRLVNGSVGVVTGFLHPLELLAIADYFAERKRRRYKAPDSETHGACTHDSTAAHATAQQASPAAFMPSVTADQIGPPPPPSWVQQLLRRGGFGSGSDVLACVETFQAVDVESLWWRMRKRLRGWQGNRTASLTPSRDDGHRTTSNCRADAGSGEATHPDLRGSHGSAEGLPQQRPKRIPYGAFYPSSHYAYWRRIVYSATSPGPPPPLSEASGLWQSPSLPSDKTRQPRPSQRCWHDLTDAELAQERLPVVRFELPAGVPVGRAATSQQQQHPTVVYALVSPITQELGGSRVGGAGSGDRAGWDAENGVTVPAVSISCRTQIPLRHAWALTVHKSQGLTLHSVQVDMANMRTPGQVYVALSRAPSLDQLTILHFDPMMVTASAEVKRFYETLGDGREDNGSGRSDLG